MTAQEKIHEYLAAHRDEMIEDIKTLIKIDSARADVLPGKPYGEGAAKALEAGLALFEKHGFNGNNCDNYAIDTTINGKELGMDILAHLDVVPGGDGWTKTTPFEPIVEDGKMFGRGTSDDKGPAVAALYAMKAVRDLGFELDKDVRLILGSDEECGSSDIAYYFGKNSHAPMTISPDADFPLVFLEKGSLHTIFTAQVSLEDGLPRVKSAASGIKVNVVPAKADAKVEGMTVAEAESYAEKVTAQTGVQFTVSQAEDGVVKIHADGVSAHAASPMDGNNALTALLVLLASLPLAESKTKTLIHNLTKLFPHGDYCGGGLGVNLEDEISGKTTLTLDLFHLTDTEMGGTFDCRACNSATEENTKDVVEQKLSEAGFETDGSPLNPPHYVPKDSKLVKTLLETYTDVTGEVREPLAIGGGTYVHHIDNGVACGCADPSVDNHMHGPDEFVIIDQLVMSAEVFALAIVKLCRN